jgi:hypothetical protein
VGEHAAVVVKLGTRHQLDQVALAFGVVQQAGVTGSERH